MNQPSTDEALMRLAQAGDRRAFDELFARWREPIFAFLLRRTGSRQAAEEAFQNAWLRVWHWRSRYDPERPFRPWLYTVASNAGYDARRPRPDDFELVGEWSSNRERRHARDELLSVLHAAPPAERRLLLLAGEGFTATEIGEMEGLRPGTVRMRLMRARQRVLAALADDES